MNAVEPPFTIVITGTASLDQAVLDHLEVAKLFLAEARADQRENWDRDVDATIEISVERKPVPGRAVFVVTGKASRPEGD